ncbi:MAG: hypothetical protein ACE5I1_12620, partial [bacterium]
MMSLQDDLLGAFEIHAPEKVEQCIANGLDVNQPFKGKTPVFHLIGMYLRSERFSRCLKILVEAGAKFKDEPVLSVLLGKA